MFAAARGIALASRAIGEPVRHGLHGASRRSRFAGRRIFSARAVGGISLVDVCHARRSEL
jgi:hypothetical protein